MSSIGLWRVNNVRKALKFACGMHNRVGFIHVQLKLTNESYRSLTQVHRITDCSWALDGEQRFVMTVTEQKHTLTLFEIGSAR